MAEENAYIIVNCEKNLMGWLSFYGFKVWKVRYNFIALEILVLDLLKFQFVTQHEPFSNELKKLVFCNTIFEYKTPMNVRCIQFLNKNFGKKIRKVYLFP
jgi:hypothetical protein